MRLSCVLCESLLYCYAINKINALRSVKLLGQDMSESTEIDDMERRQTEISLAKLEVKVDNLDDKLDKHTSEEHEDRKELAAILAGIREDQMIFKAFIAKYQGYAGAFMIIGSMLWAAVALFKEQILAWFKR